MSIYHVFKYQELRRTLFLNLFGKDEFGRHRGSVLYGMNLAAGGPTSVIVRPGAVISPYGTKFYWDETNPEDLGRGLIDISAVQVDGVSVLDPSVVRPVLVAIVANFSGITPDEQAKVESKDEMAGRIVFSARAVTGIHADTVGPALNLEPVDPIFMEDPVAPASSYDPVETFHSYGNPSLLVPEGTTAASASLTMFEVLVGYIVIGCDNTGSPVQTAIWSGPNPVEGVHVVSVKNAYDSISSIVGSDVLFGRIGGQPMGAKVGSALAQNTDGFRYVPVGSSEHKHPMQSPRYGTPTPDAGTEWQGVPWNTQYRMPSFMRDGESLLWQLRRLDYYLRLWANRTGDQALIEAVQDGDNPLLPVADHQLPLHRLILEFNGLPGAPVNKNVVAFPDATEDPGHEGLFGEVLKSGPLPHIPPGADRHTLGWGDSHHSALVALHNAFRLALVEVMGFELQRAHLRVSTLPSPAPQGRQFDDGPSGAMPAPAIPFDVPYTRDFDRQPQQPTVVGGTVSQAYLHAQSLREAVEILSQRTSSGPAGNLLSNGNFHCDDLTEWTLLGTPGDTLEAVPGSTRGSQYLNLVTVAAGDGVAQTVIVGDMLGDMLDMSGGLMSVAATLRVVAGLGVVRLEVEGLAGGITRFHLRSPDFADTTGFVNFAYSWNVDDNAADVDRLRVSVVAATDVVDVIGIAGVWLGLGMPPKSAAMNDLGVWHDFLSRDGGERSAMRGPTVLAGQEIIRGATFAEEVWLHDTGPNSSEVPVTTGIQVSRGYPERNAGVITVLDDAVEKLAVGCGDNLLKNGRMIQWLADGIGSAILEFYDQPLGVAFDPILDWKFTGDDAADNISLHGGTAGDPQGDPESWGYFTTIQIKDAAAVHQRISQMAQDAPGLPLELMAQGGVVSASAVLDFISGDSLEMEVIGYDGALVEQFSVVKHIDAAAGPRLYTMTFRAAFDTSIEHVDFRIRNASGVAVRFRVFGFSLNAGLPRSPTSRLEQEFMPRCGSKRHPMRGDLWISEDEENPDRFVRAVADPGHPTDAANLRTVGTMISAAAWHVVVAVDQKGNDVPGGTFTAGVWETKELNTLRATMVGASLQANQELHLPEGRWLIQWISPAYRVRSHQSRLLHDSGGSPAYHYGSREYAPVRDDPYTTHSFGSTVVDIVTGDFITIQHRCYTTRTYIGRGGVAQSLGTPSVFTHVTATKIGLV